MGMMINRFPHFVVRKWVSHLVGISVGTFDYHEKLQRITQPSHPLFSGYQGPDLFYTNEEVVQIVKYFSESGEVGATINH